MFSYFDKLVEDRIQKAMDEGQFKNLPGEGKPIVLSDDDFLNPDVWMRNKILKNAGYLPPWVELAWEIEHDEERFKQVQADFAAWLTATASALRVLSPSERAGRRTKEDEAFHQHVGRYVRMAEPLRDKIEQCNAMVPIHILEKVNIWGGLPRRADGGALHRPLP